jgi:thiol-disulfide isomerase/thioredoxin
VNNLALGPLSLPMSLVFMFIGVVVATSVGNWAARRSGVEVEAVLWQALAAGLVVARLAFVFQFHASYQESPLMVLDIRDGGWRPLEGFIAAWLFALWRQVLRPTLRKPLFAALAAGTVVWGSGLLLASLPPQVQPLPSLVLSDLQGAPVDLKGFQGRQVVVNLWATWCPPCVREMPVLQQAQASHPDVDFVFINQGETAGHVSQWLQARKLLLRNVLLDAKGASLAAFDQRGLPTTLFFDQGGRLVNTRTGELSAATLQEKLQSLSADASHLSAGPATAMTMPSQPVPTRN